MHFAGGIYSAQTPPSFRCQKSLAHRSWQRLKINAIKRATVYFTHHLGQFVISSFIKVLKLQYRVLLDIDIRYSQTFY